MMMQMRSGLMPLTIKFYLPAHLFRLRFSIIRLGNDASSGGCYHLRRAFGILLLLPLVASKTLRRYSLCSDDSILARAATRGSSCLDKRDVFF